MKLEDMQSEKSQPQKITDGADNQSMQIEKTLDIECGQDESHKSVIRS